MASLESVHCKILRSDQNYQLLRDELQRYFDGKAGRIVAQINHDTNTVSIYSVELPGMPLYVPLIIGDVVQNLRSALDYLVWELCLAANAEPGKSLMFPICETHKAFMDCVKRGQLRGLSEDAAAEIEALQPYHHGEFWSETALWILNELANINKHRRILLTALELTTATHDEITGAVNRANTEILSIPERQVDVDGELIAYIAFKEGIMKNAEVTSVLLQIAKHIGTEVLPRFERFFI